MCNNFADNSSYYNLVETDFEHLRKKYAVSGICAFCPNIVFKSKTFCFTGESYRSKRADMAAAVLSLGGIVKSCVTAKTNYLIVGNAGNPCWAYACYGRKIEEAVRLRKDGEQVLIINETDFWDAVDDGLAGISE